MQKEMLNINGNLIENVEIKTIQRKDGEVTVANFTLFRKMGKTGEKQKEYINCNVYGEKTEITKDFKKVISSMSTDITKKFKRRIKLTETLL